MYEVSNKAISQHSFKTTIQVFNTFSNILWDMMVFQNNQGHYSVLPQMHYVSLTMLQSTIVNFFVHY